jgi:hypothetical protein
MRASHVLYANLLKAIKIAISNYDQKEPFTPRDLPTIMQEFRKCNHMRHKEESGYEPERSSLPYPLTLKNELAEKK